jgi:hypothetical protein
MPTVNLPDGSRVNFPDGTPEQDIVAAIDALPKHKGMLETVHDVVGGATDAFTQSRLFGWGDEAGAGIRAGARGITNLIQGKDADWSGAYDRALTDIHGREETFAEEYPKTAFVSELIGSVSGGGGITKGVAKALPQVVPKVAQYGLTGAVSGALAGAGYADDKDDSRLWGAVGGGLTGGAIGAVVPTLAPIVGGAGKRLWQLAADRWGNGPANAVDRKILQGMERDATTPTRVEARLTKLGPNATIADAGGENLTGLVETAANQPGTARQMANRVLMQRQKGAGERITESSGRELGTGNFHETLDDLNKTRKTNAAPLYDEAYKAPYVGSDTVDTLLNRPSTRSALARARRIAEEEGRDPSGLGLDLDAAGNVVITKTKASMQTLDYVKRGLDDVVEAQRNDVGKLILDEEGRAINETRAKLVAELRRLNPKYGEALDAWAGPSQLMDAMHLGRRFTLPDSEVTEKIVAGMGQGEREAFLLGVQRNISDIVDRTGQTADAVRKLIGTPKMQKALQAAFPDTGSYRRFVADLLREGQFNRTKNTVLGNSATARRLASQDDLGIDPGPLVDAVQGNYMSAGKGILRNLIDGAMNMPEAQRADMARKLLSTDPVEQLAVLRRLSRRANPRRLTAEERKTVAGALVGGAAIEIPADL